MAGTFNICRNKTNLVFGTRHHNQTVEVKVEEKTSEKSLESGCVAEEGKVETYFQSPSAAPSSMASPSKVKTVNDSFQHKIEDSREKINNHPQSNLSNFGECGKCKFPIPTAKLKSHQRKKHNFRCEASNCNLAFRGKTELGTHRELDHGDQAGLGEEILKLTNNDDQKTVPNESPGGKKELKQTPSNKPQIVDSGQGKTERKTVLATEDRHGQGKSLRKTVRVRLMHFYFPIHNFYHFLLIP